MVLRPFIKEWLISNVWNGEDRSGDEAWASFTSNELQELCEELVCDMFQVMRSKEKNELSSTL